MRTSTKGSQFCCHFLHNTDAGMLEPDNIGDWSELVRVLFLERPPSPIRRELVGRPHPYHFKTCTVCCSKVPAAHLSAFVRHQSSQRLCIEAAKAESQAAVHAVGRQLQGLLTDVILRHRNTTRGASHHTDAFEA